MSIDQYFSNWDSADSYAALAITLVGFLFGLLIGYLLRGPRVRYLHRALEESNQQLVAARQESGAMKDQLDQKEAELQRINYDLVEMTERVDALEEDKAKLYKDVFHANQEVEKHQATVRAYLATIDDLNNQIADFEEQQEAGVLPAYTADTEETDHETAGGQAAPQSDLPSNLSREMLEETRLRMERFESKLMQLEAENQALKKKIGSLHPEAVPAAAQKTARSSSDLIFEIEDVEEEPELRVSPDKKVLHEKIIVTDIEKDELTKIEGVGPFLQTKLHEMGVYTYAEIANWNAARIAEVTNRIGYFPGRIEKDNWVGQARQLHHLKQTDPSALAPPVASPDDLKIVEGVGPKIEQLLKDAGIQNWNDLANAQLERLQNILSEAGERYRIHDPGTWSEQARLATEERWDDLRKLQEELKGGRKVD